jgi:hypothetical protein
MVRPSWAVPEEVAAVSTNPFQPPGTVPRPGPTLWPGSGGEENGGEITAADVYNDSTDLNQALTHGQREAYKRNLLTPGMSGWAVAILSTITFGVFGAVYLQLKQSELPVVKTDDPSAGKAIGFMFIPLFNFYWYFVVWKRLVDRINFQYRLRGHPPPLDNSQVMAAQVLSIAGWFLLGIVGFAACVWLLILGAQIQSASNRLADGRI